MPDQITVTFECKKCGGTVLELPDRYTDSSIAKCKSCGHEFGRWGDVKKQAVNKVKTDVVARVRDAFKGFGKRR